MGYRDDERNAANYMRFRRELSQGCAVPVTAYPTDATVCGGPGPHYGIGGRLEGVGPPCLRCGGTGWYRDKVCWECECPLETPADRKRGAHVYCINAHMDYVERWGNADAEDK